MSAFKALNGGSPRANDSPTERSITVFTSDDRGQASSKAYEHRSPEVSSSHKEAWQEQSTNRPPFPSGRFADADGPQKRKRSISAELRREDAPNQGQTPEATPTAPRRDSREAYGSFRRDSRQFGEEQRDRDSSWPTQHHSHPDRNGYDSHQNSASSPRGQSEDQIGDALRRATSGQMDHSDFSNASPDAEDRSAVTYDGPYGSEQRPDTLLHHDPKKRKRNFSNRTKTGCLTCRKRKKKCDEQKPECSNCIRGGFLCAGYPQQRGTGWPKPDTKAVTVPLESKDPSYIPPGAYGMPQHGAYGPQPSKREPLPHYRGQILRIDPPQGRPLAGTEDDRPTASTISTMASASATSPENKLSAVPYTPANAFPTPVSANTQPPSFADRMSKEYHQRVPPLHDLSRGTDFGRPNDLKRANDFRGSELNRAHELNRANEQPETPHPGSHLPQINILHPTRTSSPTPHPQSSSNAQAAAQLALVHPQYPPQPQRRTQKEEMLSGRHFYPFDKELCLERERCAAACWRFNNLTSPPTNGVSSDERARLFLEILQPRDPVRVSPTEASPVTNVGRVGRHVAVETPFTCDYGYNITIGHHVVLGRNCTINDVCEVKIGDNCVIGPNVSLFTASLPIDPKKRQGGQGPQFGRGIIIEQDCWIGGGAIILAGRTIGKGSTVGAGSIVTKDVPPFTIVAGNPARVLRGIGIAP
ncbi:hypothetical protein QQS21_001623 [Conoideocrella luteorostrata]|uniref:Zn(2)-C6 fungal-type domain-containing protein n=1 Tax=Conoideocrella luteorostrata TaxID=1105319 RepID=A0AAJ0G1X7_9HYPO|nr:hypothetical protein QQS21_001623 [Conoideocrella luteorostrata]